ncbi:MAG: hypothetical protein CM15mP49_20730 [Actinomycetota bacterium]|nr:MAG: hypothetical protein CM15mP49_20730 [Actinomycetota bacterium]
MIPDAHHEYVTEILEKYDVPELAETKSGQFSMKMTGLRQCQQEPQDHN